MNQYIGSEEQLSLEYLVASKASCMTSPLQRGIEGYVSEVFDTDDPYFVQVRRGIELRKFLTMWPDHEVDDGLTRYSNPRIPNGGIRFLRLTRLDELPQLDQAASGVLGLVGHRLLPDSTYQEISDLLPESLLEQWFAALEIGYLRPAIVSAGQNKVLKFDRHTKFTYTKLVDAELRYLDRASRRVDMLEIVSAGSAITKLLARQILSS